MSGKLLMFAKLSLKSFLYSLCESLHFPGPKVKEIFGKYQIEKILCYHVLTDSTSLQFIIISDPNSDFPESKIRDVLFEVTTKRRTDIYKRFDSSHPFWENVNARKEKRKKKTRFVRNRTYE